jgi:hypothetical protein
MTKERSLKALQTAAKRGDASALHELYLAHARGARGAKRDVEKAMVFLRRAAEAGHALSQTFLAREIYGEDRAGSLRWALAASEQDDVDAMVHAAEMLIAGKGVPADEAKAIALFERAAGLGSDEARQAVASEKKRIAARDRSDLENLREAIDAAGLGKFRKAIVAVATPSIRLVTTPREDSKIPKGATKLGGSPDLPASARWPEAKGKPLTFIAQLDLATLRRVAPAGVLPGAGVLSFFYDSAGQIWGSPGEDEHWRVLLSSRSKIARCAPPAGASSFRPCAIEAFGELTIPPARSALRRSLPERVSEQYDELEARFLGDYRRRPLEDGKVHRVLGHPDAIQGDMTRRIEYAIAAADLDDEIEELETRARTWRLLLQVDSDDNAEMMWGDLGRIYFWIRAEDLAVRRFERVKLQLQCS